MATTLNLQAQQDYLEREAQTRDPIRAISEFVWNSLDADATEVRVELDKNEMGGVVGLRIVDNGSGIPHSQAHHDFSNLGDSWKRKAHRTPGRKRVIHGKEGRGRLKFFPIAGRCVWTTTYRDPEGAKTLQIKIDANSLHKCEVTDPVPATGETGTVARLSPPRGSIEFLDSAEAFMQFSLIFAPYVLQYPDVRISYNGFELDPKLTIARHEDITVGKIEGPSRCINDVRLKVIEWKSATDTRQIHFGGEDGIVLGSQPAGVTAPNFSYSAYAYSSFFRELADANLLDLEGLNDPDFLVVADRIRELLTSYFRERQAQMSAGLIQELKDEGVYPYEGDARSPTEVRERQVFDIATYAVSSYSRDFKQAEPSLKRMTLALLKEAVKHNPESLSDILRSVVNLPKNKQDEFANLLKKTELSNIISASSLIAERVTALTVLKQLVFDPALRRTIKERGQLDVLIRDNTWVFGENFHITLPEAGLTKIMQRVGDEVGSRGKRTPIKLPDGRSGRADCFLGRSLPSADQARREFLLVELKRPSVVIGRKELDQVEDYAIALMQQPEFIHTDTAWHFYLVSSEYDPTLEARIAQENRPRGLFLEGANYSVWVRTWGEIVRECEARLHFIQEKLSVEVSDEELDERIRVLQQSVQR